MSSYRPPFTIVWAGRMLAYRSKLLRSATLIERYPSPTGVSSGPLRAMRVRLMESSVSSGIGSPYLATADMPATCSSHSMSAPAASRSRTVARLIDGPMPSPGIRVTLVDMPLCVLSAELLATDDQLRHAAGKRAREHARVRARRVAVDGAHPSRLGEARIHEGESQRRARRARARRVRSLEAELDREEHGARVLVKGNHRTQLRRERLLQSRADDERGAPQRFLGERVWIGGVGRVSLVAEGEIGRHHPVGLETALRDCRGDVVIQCAERLTGGRLLRAPVQLRRDMDDRGG